MKVEFKKFNRIRIDSYPQIISDLLNIRGIYNKEEADLFFNPKLNFLTDVNSIKELQSIKNEILKIKVQGEKIAIYGDYDVDGITATAILSNLFEYLTIPYEKYIPDRFEEGYGISKEGIKTLYDHGIKLIISVDCGITSVEEVEYAKTLGINIIITDHHNPGTKIPNTLVFNPKLHDKSVKYYHLSGSGIALFIFLTLYETVDNFYKSMFALSALGTIADLVPLRDDNRIIVKLGLNAMNTLKIEWLEALKTVAKLNKKLEEFHISFVIAPRLNAAGRMDNAKYAYDLLINKNTYDLAQKLNKFNEERKKEQEKIFKKCTEMIEKDHSPSIITYSTEFNRGINGIVASKCLEKYNKPAIIFEKVGTILHGSGRSLNNIDIMFIINQLKKYLISAGGHKLACGVKLYEKNFKIFKSEFNRILMKNYSEELKQKNLFVDLDINITEFNEEVVKYLNLMKPFGFGNEAPIFYLENIKILNNPILLKNKYKKYFVSQNGKTFYILDWKGETNFIKNDTVNVVGKLSINEYNGIKSIILEYKYTIKKW